MPKPKTKKPLVVDLSMQIDEMLDASDYETYPGWTFNGQHMVEDDYFDIHPEPGEWDDVGLMPAPEPPEPELLTVGGHHRPIDVE